MSRVAADHVSLDHAAHILAMSKRTLVELMDNGELPTVRGPRRQGRLLRNDVETYAAAHFMPHRYRRPDSYFVTSAGAAELLGISRPRVIQLGDKGFLPYSSRRLVAVGDRSGAWVRSGCNARER
jgi:excisionase family DNA binding protein